MSIWQSIRDRVGSARRAQTPGEADAPADDAVVGTRATGGEPDAGADDPNSTTGTTDSGTFVGRASGDEAGDLGTGPGGDERGGRGQGAARDAS